MLKVNENVKLSSNFSIDRYPSFSPPVIDRIASESLIPDIAFGEKYEITSGFDSSSKFILSSLISVSLKCGSPIKVSLATAILC